MGFFLRPVLFNGRQVELRLKSAYGGQEEGSFFGRLWSFFRFIPLLRHVLNSFFRSEFKASFLPLWSRG